LGFDIVDPAAKIVSPQKAAAAQQAVEMDHLVPWHIYQLLAAIAVPNYTKAVQTFAFNQTKADEAQIACALERYRLAQGSYPRELSDLAPQFIGSLPHDLIGGERLKYRRTPGGQYLLYSVGWNGKDDSERFAASFEQGDWIWQ
jgi:hypothetical protein